MRAPLAKSISIVNTRLMKIQPEHLGKPFFGAEWVSTQSMSQTSPKITSPSSELSSHGTQGYQLHWTACQGKKGSHLALTHSHFCSLLAANSQRDIQDSKFSDLLFVPVVTGLSLEWHMQQW